MTSLAETIDTALAAVGPETEGRLRDVVAGFEALALADEERVAALATAVAAIAKGHHGRHVAVYLEAVRAWSLEIAEMLQPTPAELRFIPDASVIEDAARNLYAGLDAVIERMRREGVDVRDRLVTELAVVARFLGQHDAQTIAIAMMAVGRALTDPAYRRGAEVRVPLREVWAAPSLIRDISSMGPQGRA